MKIRILAAISACALLLSACATPTHPADSAASAQSEAAQSSPAQAQSGAPAQPASVNLPDPRSLEGLTQVPDLEDPTPIEGTFPQKLPVTLTDFEGNSVTVTDTSRILALDLPGAISRTLIGLGYGDKLVGRTVSSTEKQLAHLPVVTENGHTLNAEAILSLQPTVIIADRSVGPPEALDQLRASGIPMVLIDPNHSIDTIDDLIMSVAHAIGADEAGKALVERTQKSIDDAKAQIKEWTPAQPLDTAFLYVRGTAGVFFILGQDEGAAALIEAVGARDVAGANGIRGVSPANAESLVTLNPEVIFVMTSGLESTEGLPGLLARPGVAETRAGQKQRVIAIPDGLSLSFGPQTGETLLAIARALYGVDSAQ
ncbi:hemin ABC transporter substrate-binding protein [Schaalia sp. Marseille-Q2122]|uniref:heme/hemin ABC transporter substrate-binding protein n=1 Tax=Schaalia sp. Marseille-Q2122 TaxID=2736604 RepID=UPI00158B5BE1|nr:ABC transporter substrate-binding protein [Schaalia sp. Marseille-Q2122]